MCCHSQAYIYKQYKALLHNTVRHLVYIEADFNDKELKFVKIEHVQEKVLLITGCNDYLIVSKIPELFGM